jgi:hypothetical protein
LKAPTEPFRAARGRVRAGGRVAGALILVVLLLVPIAASAGPGEARPAVPPIPPGFTDSFVDLMLPTRLDDPFTAGFVLDGLAISGARVDYRFVRAAQRCVVSLGRAGEVEGEPVPGSAAVAGVACEPPAADAGELLAAAVSRLTADGRFDALCREIEARDAIVPLPAAEGAAGDAPQAEDAADRGWGGPFALLEDATGEPLSGWIALALALAAALLFLPDAARRAAQAGLLRPRSLAALAVLIAAAAALAWAPGPGPVGPPPASMLPVAALLLVVLAAALVAAGAAGVEALFLSALYGLSPVFARLVRAEPRVVLALLAALLIVAAGVAAGRDHAPRRSFARESAGLAFAGVAAGLAAGRLLLAGAWGLFALAQWLVGRRRPLPDRGGLRPGRLALVGGVLAALDWLAFTAVAYAGGLPGGPAAHIVRSTDFPDGVSLVAPWLSDQLLAALLVFGLGRLVQRRAWALVAGVLATVVPGLYAWVAAATYCPSVLVVDAFVWGTGAALLAAAPAVRAIAAGAGSPRARLALAVGALALTLHAQLLARLFFDRWIFPT